MLLLHLALTIILWYPLIPVIIKFALLSQTCLSTVVSSKQTPNKIVVSLHFLFNLDQSAPVPFISCH